MEQDLKTGVWSKFLRISAVCFLAAAVVFFSFPKAFADRTDTQMSSSMRGLGMGNAVINTERGAYSVFYNPANIAAKETQLNLQVVNFQFDMSEGMMTLVGQSKYPNPMSLSSIFDNLKKSPNTYAATRASLYPNLTFRNFSVGFLYEMNQGAEYQTKEIMPVLKVKARNRVGGVAALSFRLFSGILRIGADVKYLTIGNANTLVNAPQNVVSLDFKNYTLSGTGLSKNAGMTVTLPIRFLPSFSAVYRDIGNTSYTGAKLVDFGSAAGELKQKGSIDLATGLTVYLAKRIELKVEGDYRDFTNRSQTSRMQRISVGGEMVFWDILSVRTGYEHAYLSFGLGIKTSKASLDLAYYNDELDDRLRSRKETRFGLQYTWGIFK